MFLFGGCGMSFIKESVIDPLFQQTRLSLTGYAIDRTNATGFQQCSVITDSVSRSGYYWRYSLWYDRSPTVASRIAIASQRCLDTDDPSISHNWESPTIVIAPLGLNPTNSAGDGHNSISAAVTPDGRLVIVWNAHYLEFQGAYWIGSGPGDITPTALTVKGGSTGNALPSGFPSTWSYGKLILKADGLILTARLGAAGSGAQGLWEFDHTTDTWTEVSAELISFASGSPYMQHIHVNPNTDVVHFGFTVAEGQNTTTYRDSYYFTAERSGGAGSPWTYRPRIGLPSVSLPIDDSSTFLAWATGLNRGVQVFQGLTSTDDDIPLICQQYAKDGAGPDEGSNRYLYTVVAGVWVRNLIVEVHPIWNLVDANGPVNDPDAANSEYSHESGAILFYSPTTEALYCAYRSNYTIGSDGIPVIMITASYAFPYNVWTPPIIWIDLPAGDMGPTIDTGAWNAFEHPTMLVTLIDLASQYVGGAASVVWLCDCRVPDAP